MNSRFLKYALLALLAINVVGWVLMAWIKVGPGSNAGKTSAPLNSGSETVSAASAVSVTDVEDLWTAPPAEEMAEPVLPPSVGMAAFSRYLPASGDLLVAVETLNVANLSVSAQRLLPDDILRFLVRERGDPKSWRNSGGRERGAEKEAEFTANCGNFPVRARLNEKKTVPCSLRKGIAEGQVGVFLVTLQSTAVDGSAVDPVRELVCVSDIGINALADACNADVRLWITSLSTGLPLEGVEVSLFSKRNELVGKGVSRGDGLLKIANPYGRDVAVAVATDPWSGDMAILPFENSVTVPSVSSRTYLEDGSYEAYLFTDRKIYSPGETFFIQVLVRDSKALAQKMLPLELVVTVRGPNSSLSRKYSVITDDYGSSGFDIDLPDSLPDGEYVISARLQGEDGATIGSTSVSVARASSAPLSFPLEAESDVNTPDWWANGASSETIPKLEVVTDKDIYAPGEQALITFKAPFTGYLRMDIIRHKVLRTYVFPMTNNTMDIALPVSENCVPNIRILATLVRSVKPEAVWAQNRLIGGTSIKVRPPEKSLGVTVDVPEVIEASSVANVVVQVTGESAGDARVTLLTVDENTSRLTAMKTPDPLGYFFAERDPRIAYYDVSSRLMPRAARQDVGSSGEYPGARALPQQFKPFSVASYNVVAKDGRAVIPVAAPRFSGKIRVMAIAWTASACGSGEGNAEVRFSMDEHPATPSPETLPRQISVTSVPATPPQEAAKSVPEAHSRDAEVEPAQPKLPAPAQPKHPAPAQPKLTAPAQPKHPAPAQPEYRQVAEPVVPADVVKILNTVLWESLIEQPHGSLTETISRGFVSLAVAKLPKGSFGGEKPFDASEQIDSAIARIFTMCRWDGFAMWPESRRVMSSETLYALMFIAEARRCGYGEEMVSGYRLNIKNALVNAASESRSYRDRCFAALNLALFDMADRPLMERLRKDAGTASADTRAMLARAYILCGESAVAEEILADLPVPKDLRSASFLLLALSGLNADDPRCGECVSVIGKAIAPVSGFGSDQSYAFAINVLSAYAAKF